MMKDYSQWGEQKIILDFFGDYVGNFLDIGAYDAVTESNTRALSDKGWSGLCIEASPINFAKLLDNCKYEENNKVIAFNAALSAKSIPVKFFERFGQLSSSTNKINFTSQYYINGITSDQIVDYFGDKWDFLSLDIEGSELDVLPTMSKLLKNVKLVCFEDAIPEQKFDQDCYNKIIKILYDYGFVKVIGRTTILDRTGNTLVAKI